MVFSYFEALYQSTIAKDRKLNMDQASGSGYKPGNQDPFPDRPSYKPPAGRLLSLLPTSMVPYTELMRLHGPAGYYAFYFPHLFGTLYASVLISPVPAPSQLFRANILFIIGSLFLRGAACS